MTIIDVRVNKLESLPLTCYLHAFDTAGKKNRAMIDTRLT